jgi:ubiquitin conjugation factor E4 B
VRFANGLMNETNALVASVMEKLPEIRNVQVQQRDPSWATLTEEQRNQVAHTAFADECVDDALTLLTLA